MSPSMKHHTCPFCSDKTRPRPNQDAEAGHASKPAWPGRLDIDFDPADVLHADSRMATERRDVGAHAG